MKRIYIILLLALIAAVGCKKSTFLDSKSTGLDEQAVFGDSTRTMAFLTRVYEDIGFAFMKSRWEVGNTEQATDDAEYTLENPARRTVSLYQATYSATSFPFDGMWNTPWVNIRRVNLFLSKLPSTPLSASLQRRVTGEARFLRAYYYAYLLVNFGGIPLIGEKVFGNEDIINVERSSFKDCVDYIVSELDESAKLLPAPSEYADADYGRITKGTCMALKSRVLLHAASPVFNGGVPSYESLKSNSEVKALVGYTDNNVQARWQAAAKAADDVIKSGYYALNIENNVAPGYGFYNVFLKRVNSEYILFQNRPPNRDMENHYLPSTRGGGKNSMPSQNLVDCFPMKNGKAITDPASGYSATNPYVNRDPRFGYTIIYNESLYYLPSAGAKTKVFTYENANTDGFPSTKTGYYGRKMCDENISANSSFNTNRGWPLLRYAEIILNYAEAINEATGASDAAIAPAEAYQAIAQLRLRAGIDAGLDNLYGLKPGMTKAEMRAIIRNERRIELAFEGDHRWNDMCRWGIAETVNNGYNQVMRITLSNGVYTYNRQPSTRLHSFRPEMYLFPIPLSEIRKMPAMKQNPGW